VQALELDSALALALVPATGLAWQQGL